MGIRSYASGLIRAKRQTSTAFGLEQRYALIDQQPVLCTHNDVQAVPQVVDEVITKRFQFYPRFYKKMIPDTGCSRISRGTFQRTLHQKWSVLDEISVHIQTIGKTRPGFVRAIKIDA